MAKQKRISESAVTYGLPAVDLAAPFVFERDGQPVAVLLPYAEYTELRATARDKALRQEQAWQQLDALLAKVHAQPTTLTPEEIEAEITAARQEVREARHARRRR